MKTKSSNANESHKFVPEFFQRLDLRSSNKHAAIQNFQNVREEYKGNKYNLIASTWNDEFELSYSSYSVSDMEDYIEYIIKTMKGYLLILPITFTSIQ